MDNSLLISLLKTMLTNRVTHSRALKEQRQIEDGYTSTINFFYEKDPAFSEILTREYKEYRFKKQTGLKISARKIAGFSAFKERNHLEWKVVDSVSIYFTWQDENNPSIQITPWHRQLHLFMSVFCLLLLLTGLGYVTWALLIKVDAREDLMWFAGSLVFGFCYLALSHFLYLKFLRPYRRAKALQHRLR